MKLMILNLFFISFSVAGFFNESAEIDKAEYLENERLCKLFTQKVDTYEKNMRNDFLAATTLASYKQRKKIFCKKVDESKKEIDSENAIETNVTDNNTSVIPTTEENKTI